MNKLTFKQFLMEVDVGDLQLAQQKREQMAAQAQREQGKDVFKKEMAGMTPVRGDVIQARAGKFQVTNVDRNGIQVKQLGGAKTAVLPHGTKFRQSGESTAAGKPIFIMT